MATIISEQEGASGAMNVGFSAPDGTAGWQNQTLIIIDNHTPFQFAIVPNEQVNPPVEALAGLGQFKQIISPIVAGGWNSFAGLLVCPDGSESGTAGLMVYTFDAPQSHERYYLCVLASNPYGNATKNSVAVAWEDNPVVPDDRLWSHMSQNSQTTSTIPVDGKTLTATAQIDQVTDTPRATFKLTWE